MSAIDQRWFNTVDEIADDLDDEIAAFISDARTGDADEADFRELEVSTIQMLVALRDAGESNGVFVTGDHRMEAGEDLLLAALCVDECRSPGEVRERINDALDELGEL